MKDVLPDIIGMLAYFPASTNIEEGAGKKSSLESYQTATSATIYTKAESVRWQGHRQQGS